MAKTDDVEIGEIIEPDDAHDLDPNRPVLPDDYDEDDYTAEQLAAEPLVEGEDDEA